MRWSFAAAVILSLSQLIALPALAGSRKTPRAVAPAPVSDPLDRVASAVDGAESSHGADVAMWRPDPSGPQGPMQVSEAAASDVGGGDRFDTVQNRQIGRAYLALLHRRYGDWPDAIAAYNWGIGNLEAWVKAGRPVDSSASEVASYLARVLRESGVCAGDATPPVRQAATKPSDCAALVNWQDSGGRPILTTGATRQFYRRLDNAMALAVRNARMR
ncbi:MAG TPA: lytic transglycosylase domain-containing protein [Stellaceae bacterium]|nr:lytic transglycosylase domain-containing protein [Stellaceae bacterium]